MLRDCSPAANAGIAGRAGACKPCSCSSLVHFCQECERRADIQLGRFMFGENLVCRIQADWRVDCVVRMKKRRTKLG